MKDEQTAVPSHDFRRRALLLGARQQAYKQFKSAKLELQRQGVDPGAPEFAHLWERLVQS